MFQGWACAYCQAASWLFSVFWLWASYPLQEGWLIFYGPEHQGVSEECMGKLCVVQVKDGATLLKTLKRGSRKGLFRLESWNAPPREDIKIAWAAPVVMIKPR